jgi:hypothetical protein
MLFDNLAKTVAREPAGNATERSTKLCYGALSLPAQLTNEAGQT